MAGYWATPTDEEREELVVGDEVIWKEEEVYQKKKGRILAITAIDFAIAEEVTGRVVWKHHFEFEIWKRPN